MALITLTTDFGTADGYVGALKGVIYSLAPQVTLVDISHAVPPQDVRHGARVLATAAPYFPPGTIHVGVIDPGVGSERRGIALQTGTAFFVGPDNGLFSPFLSARQVCVALTNPALHRQPVSATFHGRDIFAPVAAHLATGGALSVCGCEVEDPRAFFPPEPRRLENGDWQAEVVYVDHFGNLVTNLRGTESLQGVCFVLGKRDLPVSHTYADVAPGSLVALVGSDGYLEIAVRDGSAAQRLGIGTGAQVRVRWAQEP